jgi:RHS repeat-associated protein
MTLYVIINKKIYFWILFMQRGVTLRDLVGIKIQIMENLAKMYSNSVSSLDLIESELNKKLKQLDWKVSEKENINENIRNATKKTRNLKNLNQDIKNYINNTINTFVTTDESVSKKLADINNLIKGTAKEKKGGISGWFGDMKQKAGNIINSISKACGDPVNIATGNFITKKIDLRVEGYNPLEFNRFYNSIDEHNGVMGNGWHHSYEIKLEKEEDRINVIFGDGRLEEFLLQGGVYEAKPENRNKLLIDEDKAVLIYPDGGKLLFNIEKLHLESMIDRSGNVTDLIYKKNLICVKNDCGRIDLQYNADNLLEKIEDNTKRSVKYRYKNNLLWSINDVKDNISKYEYDSSMRIHKIYGPDGKMILENNYDGYGRTIEQTTADGVKTYYSYDDEANVSTFTQRNGAVEIHVKDDKGRITQTVYENGVEKKVFDNRNQVLKSTDKNGNTYEYTYDENGNVVSETDAMGTTIFFEYDKNNNMTKIKKPDNSEYIYVYDDMGNMIKAQDTLNRTANMKYNQKGQVVQLIQPDESSINFVYDEKGNIVETEDANGFKTNFEYDDLNRLVKSVKPMGNTVHYEYMADGKFATITAPDGSKKSKVYNENGMLVKDIEVDGQEIKYTYDEMENLVGIEYPDGRTINYEYDVMGNSTKVIRPDKSTIQYEYDLQYKVIAEIDPAGNKVISKYDRTGNVIESIDKRNNSSKFKYDALNRIIESENAKGNKSKYTYDFDGNLITIIDALNNKVEHKYDVEGQRIKSINPNGDVIEYKYDLMGRVTSFTNPLGDITNYKYDKNGNLIRVIHPDKSMELFEYDKNGNVTKYTNQANVATYYRYDVMERLVSTIDTYGNSKSLEYDIRGQITSILDELGNRTQYKYNKSGNLVEVIDATGHSTKYNYNIMGQLTEVHRFGTVLDETISKMYASLNKVNSENKVKEYITKLEYYSTGNIKKETNPSGLVTEYKYDEAGNVISRLDRDGFETTYEYDMLNNLSKIKYSDEKEVKYEYDELDNIVSMTDWLGNNKFELDRLGRITKLVDYKNRIVEYGWNKLNDRDYIIYPDRTRVDYEYDNMRRLTEVTESYNKTQFEYDIMGKITKNILPDGTIREYSYDPLHKLKKLISIKDGKIIDNREYEYDSKGNKTGKIENGNRILYKYDRINQLIEEISPQKNITKYFYDTIGNRVRVEDWGLLNTPEVTEYSYDENEHLKSISGKRTDIFGGNQHLPDGIQMKYDKRGNLTKAITGNKIIAELIFDETNNLTKLNSQINKSNFVYDGFNRRVGVNTKDILCDITRPFNSVLQEGNNKYIYGSKITPISSKSGFNDKFYLDDELGSPVKVIGDKIKEQTYDSFGKVTNGDDFISYTGYQNHQIGIMYGQARYLMPETGRFISDDSDKGNIVDIPTLNINTYCSNNPINYIDPSGNTVCSAFDDLKSWGPKILDGLQLGLDVAGLIPGIGEIADGINAGIYLARGDYVAAGLSAAAMIPFLGWGATGGKLISKVVKYAGKVDNVIDAGKALSKVDNVIDAGKALNKVDDLASIGKKCDYITTFCFTAGTIVKTANGDKSIEDIEIGDDVYAENEVTGEKGLKKVTKLFKKETNTIVRVKIEDEDIETTKTHPFFVVGVGWVNAENLEIGDIVKLATGEKVKVQDIFIEVLDSPVIVYNFTVEDWHTYYVCRKGILVHNSNCGDEVGEYLAKKAPKQVTPGIRQLEGQYVNDRGIVQPWVAHYDEYGRLAGRTDYNAGNRAAGIPDTHYHTYEWGPGKTPLETGTHIEGEFIP